MSQRRRCRTRYHKRILCCRLIILHTPVHLSFDRCLRIYMEHFHPSGCDRHRRLAIGKLRACNKLFFLTVRRASGSAASPAAGDIVPSGTEGYSSAELLLSALTVAVHIITTVDRTSTSAASRRMRVLFFIAVSPFRLLHRGLLSGYDPPLREVSASMRHK